VKWKEMKLTDWAKIVWWLILLAFFIYLLSQRFEAIIQGVASAFDIVIFLILIALATIPLFQEVDFFGVRLKKEIDTLRTEFKEQIINLRSDINTINMRAEISPHINLLTPRSDSEIINLEEQIKPILEKTLKAKGIGIEKEASKFEVSDDIKFLFDVRYTIEKELRRIWRRQWASAVGASLWTGQPIEEQERPKSVFQITSSLERLGVITPEISGIIRELYRACSPAIHGEKVSQTAVGFVRDVAPGLIASLKEIEGVEE
jgi:hypothetical protein